MHCVGGGTQVGGCQLASMGGQPLNDGGKGIQGTENQLVGGLFWWVAWFVVKEGKVGGREGSFDESFSTVSCVLVGKGRLTVTKAAAYTHTLCPPLCLVLSLSPTFSHFLPPSPSLPFLSCNIVGLFLFHFKIQTGDQAHRVWETGYVFF